MNIPINVWDIFQTATRYHGMMLTNHQRYISMSCPRDLQKHLSHNLRGQRFLNVLPLPMLRRETAFQFDENH